MWRRWEVYARCWGSGRGRGHNSLEITVSPGCGRIRHDLPQLTPGGSAGRGLHRQSLGEVEGSREVGFDEECHAVLQAGLVLRTMHLDLVVLDEPQRLDPALQLQEAVGLRNVVGGEGLPGIVRPQRSQGAVNRLRVPEEHVTRA